MNQKTEAVFLSGLKVRLLQRWIGIGARENELFETYSRIKVLADWCKEFSEVAQRFEKVADAAQDSIVKASNYRTAAIYYHIAQLGHHADNEEKIQTYYSAVRAYQKGARYYWRPVEVVEYPFLSLTLSAYFRKTLGAEKSPCVIIVRGADASSEGEGHVISDYLLERGLATLDIDCPGQYQARFNGLYMTPDFEKPVGAALNYLETRSDIDSDKIAILGLCFGGFIAPLAASQDKRLKACVSVGGFYSLDEFEYHLSAVLNLQNDMGITAVGWPQARKKYTLEGVIDKMICPLLVVNGSADVVMPVSQSIKIYEKANCPKELKIYEGYGHMVFYENRSALTYIADWISAKLQV